MLQGPGPEAWHPNPDFYYVAGGGPLFDMGPYYLTTLVQNLGPVARVAATHSTARTTRTIGSGPRAGETVPVETPTHFSALLEFESGATAQCVFSFQSSIRRAGFVEFAGTEGAIVFPDPNMFDGELAIWTDAVNGGRGGGRDGRDDHPRHRRARARPRHPSRCPRARER